MPWWSWILIWLGVVIVLLAVLAAFAAWYWRLVRAVLAESAQLTLMLGRLSRQLEGLSTHEPVPDDAIPAEELQRLRGVWASRLTRQRFRARFAPKRRNVAQRGERARQRAAAHPDARHHLG